MSLTVILQNDLDAKEIPKLAQFQTWANAVFNNIENHVPEGVVEFCIRIVDENESAELNKNFRQKPGPTNVLSFSRDPEDEDDQSLGDIAICAPRVVEEANEEGIPVSNHWAHLTIHGILHLLGFDHIDEEDAIEMESLEVMILKTLNIPNPYIEDNDY